MSEGRERNEGLEGASPDATRPYMFAAAALTVIIVIAAILLVTVGLPALRGESNEVAGSETTPLATPVPTSTSRPTPEPADTLAPSPSPTMPALVMGDTDNPAFQFVSAGGRPSEEWTGFFGQVLDAGERPLPGVPIIVWHQDGQPASPPVQTGRDGAYQIRLAGGQRAGTWTIQVLTAEGQPASKLFTFQTDENTATGIQQIQVIWKQMP